MDDKNPKAVIREELKKLSALSWGERVGYIWDYYKPLMAAILVIIFFICLGVEIYRNLQKDYLLNAYFVNSNTVLSDYETMTSDFEEYIGGLEKNQVVNIDTTLTISEDLDQYSTASQTKLTAIASTGDLDVIVMDAETFERYYREGFFADLSEVLTEEQLEQWEERLIFREPVADSEEESSEEANETEEAVQGATGSGAQSETVMAAIDISDLDILEQYNIYTDQKVYAGVFARISHPEMIRSFFDFLLK